MKASARPGYWSFYWPLALTSVVLLLERQFQNGVLARYPDAAVGLATFALAASSFQLVHASLSFIPQMIAVQARTRQARRACRNFVVTAGCVLSLPLVWIGFTATGQHLLAGLLNIPEALLPDVTRYLRWLAPLVLVDALRQYNTGILVLGEKTRRVTLLNAVHMLVLIGMLLAGRHLGWGALPTIALATISSNVLHLVLGLLLAARVETPDHGAGDRLTWTAMLRFFWPVAVTSTMFALTRPVLYAYVNLTDQAVVNVAALRMAFDFAIFFQHPVNQFRHLYATFGAEDPAGVRRFMLRTTAVLVTLMAVIVFTPASRFIFGRILGAEGEVLRRTVQAMGVLCLAPLVIALRNLSHGKMLVLQRTLGMAGAGVLRVGATALAAKGLYHLGLLNHRTACLVLVLGFSVEALAAHAAIRKRRSG